MSTYRVITERDGRPINGSILHDGVNYKPGDVFPAKGITATEEQIAHLLAVGAIEQIDGRTVRSGVGAKPQ